MTVDARRSGLASSELTGSITAATRSLSSDERSMIFMNRDDDATILSNEDPRATEASGRYASGCGDVLPSFRTVLESVQLLVETFRDLSCLGKTQVAVLLLNLIATFALVYSVSSAQHRRTDFISLYFGVEFILLTACNIVYTVCVENTYAFYGLIFLELEVAAFVTTSAVVGVLTILQPPLRWFVVGLNWASIMVFLLLQRGIRRTWGWHAYRLAGITASAVLAYREYQQFAAVLLLDVFHAVFFLTAEEVIRSQTSLGEQLATYLCAGGTLVLARYLQVTIRHERKCLAWCLFCLYCLPLGCYFYFAISNTQKAILGQGHVADDDDIGSSGERTLVAALEWCVVAVRVALLCAVSRVISSFSGTLPQMFPRRALRSHYIIDDAAVEQARTRATSVATPSPRHVRMYDTIGPAVSARGVTQQQPIPRGAPQRGAVVMQQSATTLASQQPIDSDLYGDDDVLEDSCSQLIIPGQAR